MKSGSEVRQLPMNGLGKVLFAMFTAVLLMAGNIGPAPAAAGEAGAFIQGMGQEAIASLTKADLSQDEREARFRKILKRTFDMKTIARFTLGRYWRIASKEERDEFTALFKDFIVKAYSLRFRDYSGETFKVGRVRKINERDKLVLSKIVRVEKPPVHINWRIRGNSEYKIVDVVVEGVSMGITQRDEFASVIRSNGGKIAGLLTALRKKNSKK